MRTPAIPQEFDNSDYDRQAYAGDSTKDGDTHKANYRKSELPTLDAKNSNQIRDLDQADSRSNYDRSQGGGSRCNTSKLHHTKYAAIATPNAIFVS